MKQASQFDAMARDWDKRPDTQERAQLFRAALERHVPLTPSMDLLEFGCGTGLVSIPWSRKVHSICMVDTSQGMLDVVGEKLKAQGITSMSLHAGDLFDRSFGHSSLDLIYSLMTLHHVPDTQALLKRTRQLLRPGGWLCLADLEPEDGSFHGPEVQVHHGFNPQQLKGAFEQTGFKVVALERMHVMRKANAQGGMRDYPIFFIAGQSAE